MLLFSAPAVANDADLWVLFSNTRFGTIAEIPQGLFKAQQPPANGDGRTFRSKDGAEVRIFGNYNTEETFGAYKQWLWDLLPRERIRVSYKTSGEHWQARSDLKNANSPPVVTGGNWLAYSGYQGSNIVYRKQIEGCDALHTVSAVYPRALRAKYDPVVARIAGALRCKVPLDCRKGQSDCTYLVPEYNDGVVWPD
ncbi:hypothetical protein FV226_27115 [Methylobacterium sp. WL12]|uniref:hypothetical protein n=1 Tax=Methylobacterium sp. WL12 TaxID=2603890 RepID=UPI0011C8AEAE|nr:hypothetical protein [Methylobacterium sp. WL12]TXM63905.1 hypothetical protein FV226_27115 [Methylobacterium sp. WL12]